ncbi:barstar family protein [Streptomyces litchfieldiae]|uniref:Barstar family protein n=1 Tax=Streptomyces litchfieldiae TaxID=3075543 RepID=A0ABU2N201_9ACTN|nr:barstar family protein [Streptomyces sp. DSM 44938]MDT0347637.1 barstar family protein [Streptomyces sp. DSM 44938]
MTSGDSWWTPLTPRLHVVGAEDPVQVTDSLSPTGMSYVARLDGESMADVDGVFTQFWEHLRLPSYFGWNWDALSDCLRDLHWLQAERYLVVISRAEDVLSETPDERGTFFQVIARATASWANAPAKVGVGIPFNVVLLCARENLHLLGREVSAFETA